MEKLSWMRKVDMRMDKLDLLDIIDHLHEVINAAIIENEKKGDMITELRDELKKSNLQ
ncbi:MAG TPA: hypothetical protein VFC70_00730 [Oscillospiraceae bacterium]|nr:hypothetical protein [Oscillospiraceae bacterium]